MNRRQLILRSTAFGLSPLAATLGSGAAALAAAASPSGAALPVPSTGPIPVAFLLSDGAVVIDFCGPWQVFESVSTAGR